MKGEPRPDLSWGWTRGRNLKTHGKNRAELGGSKKKKKKKKEKNKKPHPAKDEGTEAVCSNQRPQENAPRKLATA